MVDVMEIMDSDDSTKMLVVDLIKKLQDRLALIPEEVRATAFVNLHSYGEYSSAQLDLEREETSDERNEREEKEAARRKEQSDYMAASERSTYLRLKSKFEGG